MDSVQGKLDAYRVEIDKIDTGIVALLSERMEVAGKIGKLKAEAGLPVLNAEREKALKERVSSMAPCELSSHISSIYDAILKESRKYQGEK